MVFALSSPARSDSDTESGGKALKLVLKLGPNGRIRRKAPRLLAGFSKMAFFRPHDGISLKALRLIAGFPGVQSVAYISDGMLCEVVGFGIDATQMVGMLREQIGHAEILGIPREKIGPAKILSDGFATARNDSFPTTVRITELQPDEDADLERKRSSGMLSSEEQQEQSEKQQEDRPPPGKAISYISQVEASPLSRPLPPLSLPLASEAQPSSSPVSPPSQGMSDQMQAAPAHTPELSSSSSCIFWTESLVDMPAHSSISGGACLPEDMKLMEEEGLGGHDQLYDSAVHDLLSGINRIDELKRHYDLRAREQANRLKEAEDTTIMLRKNVEELEAKLLMANMPEHHLMDMVCTSEYRHARTERELALMREKMDEANRRIEYLEAADSRYQNRIAVAKIENEKAGERACRASIEGETTSTTRPSPPAPRSTSLSFVPLLLLVLFSQAWRCARKALFFLDVSSYLDYLE